MLERKSQTLASRKIDRLVIENIKLVPSDNISLKFTRSTTGTNPASPASPSSAFCYRPRPQSHPLPYLPQMTLGQDKKRTHLPLPVSLNANSISNSYFGDSAPGSIRSVMTILARLFPSLSTLALELNLGPSISFSLTSADALAASVVFEAKGESPSAFSGESERMRRQYPKWRPLPRMEGRRRGTTSDGLKS